MNIFVLPFLAKVLPFPVSRPIKDMCLAIIAAYERYVDWLRLLIGPESMGKMDQSQLNWRIWWEFLKGDYFKCVGKCKKIKKKSKVFVASRSMVWQYLWAWKYDGREYLPVPGDSYMERAPWREVISLMREDSQPMITLYWGKLEKWESWYLHHPPICCALKIGEGNPVVGFSLVGVGMHSRVGR